MKAEDGSELRSFTFKDEDQRYQPNHVILTIAINLESSIVCLTPDVYVAARKFELWKGEYF